MAIHLFNYDIPEVAVQNPDGTFRYRNGRIIKRPVMPNPSGILWSAGAVRLTDSCWLVHDGAVPPVLVNNFTLNGVKWNSAPFDPKAAETLAAIALTNIRSEIRQYLDRAADTREEAEQELAEANGAEGVVPGSDAAKAALKRYRSKLASITRRVRKALASIQVAAERFGLGSQTGVPDAISKIDGVKAVMERQAEAFAEAYGIVRKARGKKDAMATAMARGDVYGPIAADYLEETVGTPEAKKAAKKLRVTYGYDDF